MLQRLQRTLRHRASLLGAVLLSAVVPAAATTITFTSYNAWTGDVSGTPKEIDFSSVGSNSYSTSAGVTLSGFKFTGPNGSGGYTLNGGLYPFGRYNVEGLFGANSAAASIVITTPVGGENAMLFAIGSSPSGAALTVTLSDGETFSATGPFFGFALSHTINSVTVSSASGMPVVFDGYWGPSTLTQDSSGSSGNGSSGNSPEGATLILIAGGGLVLLGANKRRPLPLGV